MIRTVNLSLTAELLTEIDEHCKERYASRSEYIRHAVIEQMRHDASINRRATPKRLPTRHIKSSVDDEYAIADEYEM